MIPIQYIFRATLDDFKKPAQFLMNNHFQLDRLHDTVINKQQVLSILQGLIEEPLHYQDWQEPKFIFFVEVNGAIMYISTSCQPILNNDICARNNNLVDKIVKILRYKNK